MAWTELQKRQLTQFFGAYGPGDKPPVAEIALVLRKSEAAVKAMANKMGLLRSYTATESTCQGCGKQFHALGYESDRGGGLFCSIECSAASRNVPRPAKEELKALYENGKSTNDLAEHFGVAKGTIYNWMKAYDISTRDFSEAAEVLLQSDKGQQMIDAARATKLSRHGKLMFGRGSARSGRREDLGIYTRSSWEANVLRWLNLCAIKWEYEPRCFEFPLIKRGTRSYMPDIYLPEEDKWIEVKGYFSDKDRTRTKRFQKYYPEEAAKLYSITKSEGCAAALKYYELGVPTYAFYDDLKIAAVMIPNWE